MCSLSLDGRSKFRYIRSGLPCRSCTSFCVDYLSVLQYGKSLQVVSAFLHVLASRPLALSSLQIHFHVIYLTPTHTFHTVPSLVSALKELLQYTRSQQWVKILRSRCQQQTPPVGAVPLATSAWKTLLIQYWRRSCSGNVTFMWSQSFHCSTC